MICLFGFTKLYFVFVDRIVVISNGKVKEVRNISNEYHKIQDSMVLKLFAGCFRLKL